MVKVTFTVMIPDDGCGKYGTRCRYLRELEVIEVGFSPNQFECDLFHRELDWRNPQPCPECVRARKRSEK